MTHPLKVAPGSVIAGKYRVERELGSGGMGVVVEATHFTLGQRVAVKLLNPTLALAGENVVRFLREARVAATLPSEHIARVHDVGQMEDGTPYLVMDLLVGNDLAAEIARAGALPVAAAVGWVLETCEGLADAHAAGVVHRDIKPQNLFIARRPGRPPVLKILDFGLTKDTGRGGARLTTSDALCGTPQYMAPEQVLDPTGVDARCDQHALGMVLFEALTGRTAYTAPNPNQLLLAVATAPPPSARALRADVPRALDQAIQRALAKVPGDRFPDVAAFAEAIAPFAGERGRDLATNVRRVLHSQASRSIAPGASRGPAPSGTDLTSSSENRRRARKSLRLAVGVGAGVVVLTGAAALVVVVGRSSPPIPAAAPAEATLPATTIDPPATAAAPKPPPDTPASATSAPAESAAPTVAASSSAGARNGAAKGTSKGAPANAVRKAIGVFGGERR